MGNNSSSILKKENSLTANGLFLLDMDGTIYNQNTLFDGVKELLNLISDSGGRYIFVTNNSSKSVNDYIKKLSNMGITSCEKDFFTSTQATILYLNEHFKNKKIFCVGTRSFVMQLKENGIDVTEENDERSDVVLVAYDTELNYQKLVYASELLYKDKVFLATNCDRGCPVSFGLVPDCAAICEALYFATSRRPKYIGKPEPDMILYAMKLAGYSCKNTVVVGDRLYTDILSGINAGVKTVLVFSGETTPEMLEASSVKPDFVYDNINALLAKLKNKKNDD